MMPQAGVGGDATAGPAVSRHTPATTQLSASTQLKELPGPLETY